MKAAAYVRVSDPKEDTENPASLDEQRQTIEDYCQQQGHEIVTWYQDIGSEAYERRGAFLRMTRDAQVGKFDVIVEWKPNGASPEVEPAAVTEQAAPEPPGSGDL